MHHSGRPAVVRAAEAYNDLRSGVEADVHVPCYYDSAKRCHHVSTLENLKKITIEKL